MAQELWIIEASFIANGIRYGFEGDRLREYVEKRLRQSEEFEELSARRQEGALRTEFNEKLKKINERIASGKYEGAKRDLLATRERTPDKAWKTLLTDKQRSEEHSKPVGGSDPRPTGSVQCMATSVGDAQKQLESRPNDVEANDVEAQDVQAQDVEVQDVEAQDVEAQDVEAQDVEAQDVEAQDVEAQDVEAQDVEAQDVEAQDVEAQELEAQELAQELEAKELEAQELEAQELEAQELEAQDLETQGVVAEKMRRVILLVSTEEVSGETVWNTEIRGVSSDSAPAPGRSSVPVTVSWVTAHIVELYDIIGCVLSGPASASCRSGSVTVSCATAHSGKLREIKMAEVVGISDILPWPPPQQQMTRSKPQIV